MAKVKAKEKGNFICKVCQNKFKPDSHYKTRPPKFCSLECSKIYFEKTGHFKRMSRIAHQNTHNKKFNDEQILEVYRVLLQDNKKSIHPAFCKLGYKSPEMGIKRLKKIIGENLYRELVKSRFRPPSRGNARRGTEKERELFKRFVRDGWFVVRSAGSKGIWDLIASNESQVIYIQVKRTKSPYPVQHFIPAKEIRRMVNFKVPPNCKKELWIWRDHKGWQTINILDL